MKGKKGTAVTNPSVTQSRHNQAIMGKTLIPKVHILKLIDVTLARNPPETCSIAKKNGKNEEMKLNI